MAANNQNEQKKAGAQATLLAKLDLNKDERLTRTPIETGRISHCFNCFKKSYTDLMLANLLLIVFALPAILTIFWLIPSVYKAQNMLLDFNGDMGIGFGGSYDTVKGMLNIYNAYEMMFYILVPCFSLIGLGMAGVFYVCRNILWGAPVKIRVHFFRGIKKRWAEFLLGFTYLGGVTCMMGCSILEYLKADVTNKVNAGHWIFMIVSAIVFLLSVLYLMISLPMEDSFRFKFASVIKNSCILGITMIIPMIILLIFIALPALMMLNSFLRIIYYVFLAMIGFSVMALMVTALAHNIFDSTIIPLYEYEQKKKEREERKEKDRQNRQQKKSKKKRK